MQPAVQWSLMCNVASEHADTIVSMCSTEATRIIRDITVRFTSQAIPTTADETAIRKQQQWGWQHMMSLVSHADAMAQTHPRAADRILAIARTFCEIPFPKTQEELEKLRQENFTAMSAISQLC